MKTRLEVVRLADILISKTNPRKTFDEADLAELAKSVKENGVLQPILIRPLDLSDDANTIDLTAPKDTKQRLPRFELVCGERRYRAATIAGLTDIPANIRELDDEQAFELQIIENLQRKDVHPLEEAEAYKRMLDSGRYEIPDIAGKLAKSETFIQQRLKFNDLIEEIRQDFLHNDLSIGHAVEIARLSAELQQGLMANYRKRWNVSGWGTLKQLKDEIGTQSMDMATAQFLPEEGYGIGKVCVGCAHRSITNPALFADMQGDNCFNKACFSSKTEAYIAQKTESLIASGEEVFLASPSYYDPPAAVKKIATKQKMPILDSFNKSQHPNTVKRSVFFVAGPDAGKTLEVYVSKDVVKSTTPEKIDFMAEIQNIETKAKRALELDQEKIHTTIINELKAEFGRHKMPEFNFDKEFLEAFLFWQVLYSADYTVQNALKKLGLPSETNFDSVEAMVKAMQAILPAQRKAILVTILFEKYRTSTTDSWMGGKLIRKLADANPHISIEKIKKAQSEAATKRIARENERLAELRGKLGTKKESKKGTAKT